VGCGNSKLSADLYDVGYRQSTSIDVSEVVVRQMRSQNGRERPDLRFEVADATQMPQFADGSFSCVLDKGTLDAMFTDAEADAATVNKMFAEIGRVLRLGGRYVCISLLQPHILAHFVDVFAGYGWPVRVVRCKEADSGRDGDCVFPVFALVATKFKKMPKSVQVYELAMSADAPNSRLTHCQDLIDSVRGIQQFSAARAGAAKRFFARGDARQEEMALELKDGQLDEAKYSLYIAECAKSGGGQHQLNFAVFIVPQGRDTEWLFSTVAGRQQLAESASCKRLVVAHLHRSHDFPGGLKAVQAELSDYVMELAPADLPAGERVPFLSVGAEDGAVSARVERCRGRSHYSGEFVVEDVEVNGDHYRRLVFMNNKNLTQSEAKLKLVKGKNKKATKRVIDHDYLACAHHSTMLAAIGLFPELDPVRVLLIGLGGGGLATFVGRHFPKVSPIL